MESKAVIKFVRISPQKLREVVHEAKKMTPAKAMAYLVISQRRGAKILYKAIKSAVDNGKSKNIDPELSVIKTLKVDGDPSLKRNKAGSRGSAKPYVRKSSHITVVIQDNKPTGSKDSKKPTIKDIMKTGKESTIKTIEKQKKTDKKQKYSKKAEKTVKNTKKT